MSIAFGCVNKKFEKNIMCQCNDTKCNSYRLRDLFKVTVERDTFSVTVGSRLRTPDAVADISFRSLHDNVAVSEVAGEVRVSRCDERIYVSVLFNSASPLATFWTKN